MWCKAVVLRRKRRTNMEPDYVIVSVGHWQALQQNLEHLLTTFAFHVKTIPDHDLIKTR